MDKIQTQVPESTSPEVIAFCKEISPSRKPIYLKIKKEASATTLNCFDNVQNKANQNGGKVRFGWIIWEWKDIMIEAEFHAVWMDSNGQLVDITPNGYGFKRILFLIDDNKIYEGEQVNNIRKALSDDPLIDEYIKLNDKLFCLMNIGMYQDRYGEVELNPHMQAPVVEKLKEIYKELCTKYSV